PTTPQHDKGKIQTSPVVPTPSKLPRFLEYAAQNLGVTAAPDFESRMHHKGYGPDILHMVENKALKELGMTLGDALYLKAGSLNWWNGPDAKRKRSNSDEVGKEVSNWTPARVFEVCHTDGGLERFYGPKLVQSD
ncbi:hypothetical protein B0H13DRAFT_1553262, partial [Mycena leptocephala]